MNQETSGCRRGRLLQPLGERFGEFVEVIALGNDLAGRIEQPIRRQEGGDPGIATGGNPSLRPRQVKLFQRRFPCRGILVQREAEQGQLAGSKSFAIVAPSGTAAYNAGTSSPKNTLPSTGRGSR